MKLGIKERLVFNQLYPRQSNLRDQIMVRDISKKVELTQDELKGLNVRPEGNSIRWDPGKGKPKEVEFSDAELDFLRSRVDELDKQKQMTTDLVDTCLKIKDAKNESAK